MKQFTKDQAIAFAKDGLWKELSYRQRATFQTEQNLLCMPFDIYHEAMEKTLGRSVFTNELGLNRDGLRAELNGDVEAPTLEEILNMIPEEKRVIITVDGDKVE